MVVTIEEAQDVYRTAWCNYLLTEDEGRRQVFGDVMDGAQEHCVTSKGPGPEWDTFIDALPGFREHWDRWGSEMKEKMSNLIGAALRASSVRIRRVK